MAFSLIYSETLLVEFDPSVVNYAGILRVFWGAHDSSLKYGVSNFFMSCCSSSV